MLWIDWVFPFWRATWELFVLVPYRRIKSWWWKRNHPIEYQILKAGVEAFEARVAERGWMLVDPARGGRVDGYYKYRLYADLVIQEAARTKITMITDVIEEHHLSSLSP